MLSHHHIWAGIDALARRHALTPSGLARLAGLDATTFNRSKRFGSDGKPRWPSTESIAKVLDATGASFREFAAMADDGAVSGRRIPLLGLLQAGDHGAFDEAGLPAGAGWEECSLPDDVDEAAYALEVSGDSMEPVYRPGDRIIVAPGHAVRPGDRVVVRTCAGEILVRTLARMTARRIELISLNPAYPRRLLDVKQVAWIARVRWASQ
jgi:phage repressor protein C with HTH and peptisase S24 domain